MGLASALSTALTGLSASETMISVAGNNISNSQTDGFKQSQALFTTQFLQTLSLGSASGSGHQRRHESAADRLGYPSGRNHARFQPGYHSNQQQPVGPGDSRRRLFHRGGSHRPAVHARRSFQLNSSNHLVTTTGQTLLGYGVDQNFNVQKTTLQPLSIPLGSTAVAQATQNVYLQGDLSPTETVATTPQIIQSQTLSDASIESPPHDRGRSSRRWLRRRSRRPPWRPTPAPGNVAAGTYNYEITYVNAAGQESPALDRDRADHDHRHQRRRPGDRSERSAVDSQRVRQHQHLPLRQLAPATSWWATRPALSFTDDKSDAQLGATLNGSTLAAGNYSYYVTYYNSVTGEESRPTPLIGPEAISSSGRRIELEQFAQPATSAVRPGADLPQHVDQ